MMEKFKPNIIIKIACVALVSSLLLLYIDSPGRVMLIPSNAEQVASSEEHDPDQIKNKRRLKKRC